MRHQRSHARPRRHLTRRPARLHAMPRRRSGLRRAAGGAFAVGVTVTSLTAGVAFAAWLANGTGTAYGKAKQKQALVTESAVAQDTLHPGATGDLTFRARNPNPYPVVISTVEADPARQISPADCDVSFARQSGLSLSVPANSAATFTLPGSVSMGFNGSDDCAGQTIAIPIAMQGATPQPTSSQVLETFATPVANSYYSLANGSGLGQSFTRPAGVTQLTRVDVFVNGAPSGTNGGAPATNVTIWPGAPGVGTPIATQSFPSPTYAQGQWTRFDLASPVSVPASFAVTFDQPTFTGFYPLSHSGSNPYAGGSAFFKNGSQAWSNSTTSASDLQLRLFGL